MAHRGSIGGADMSDPQAGPTADRRDRLPGWLRFGLIAVASLLAAGAAFLLAAASFGSLSLPILVLDLVIGGTARSPGPGGPPSVPCSPWWACISSCGSPDVRGRPTIARDASPGRAEGSLGATAGGPRA